MKLRFLKNKVVSGKTAFLAIGLLFTLHSIFLTLAFGKAFLYGNNALLITVLPTKNRFSILSEKVFIYRKSCFKVKTLKIFEISSDCHIEMCRSLKPLCEKQ